MPPPEPNPQVALNNAREESRYPDYPAHQVMTPLTGASPNTGVNTYIEEAFEDRARIKFLIDSGATWQIPFLHDGPYDFNRETIDTYRRKEEAP